ncbi:hypothetical protein CRG98_012470 [Punica granatum]|uniref:Uncharacterized protein n=1 Tax=Punica granatum TaxID=22663 RepID=A0A2I0KF61_PUNGR|nr:hypothetical protein CRG98_012470 [Punica granatum]
MQSIETRTLSRTFPQGRGAHDSSMTSHDSLLTTLSPLASSPCKLPYLPFKIANRVDPRLFSKNDDHSHLRRSIRVDPITLGANDHHGHLEGSLSYPEPLTLPQNSIGSLRDDVRPNLCQSGLFSFQPSLLRLFGSMQGQNSPNSTQQRSNPTFCSPIPYLGTSLPCGSSLIPRPNNIRVQRPNHRSTGSNALIITHRVRRPIQRERASSSISSVFFPKRTNLPQTLAEFSIVRNLL